jgi:glycosyl transferase family 25
MQYKIYLINLSRAGNRLVAMQKKFDDLGLSFERIEAVDGRAMSKEQKHAFAIVRPRANGWLPGAIGCFRSHYLAWTAIAKGDAEFGVVFEDDVHISSKLPDLLANIGQYLNDFDVVRLEASCVVEWRKYLACRRHRSGRGQIGNLGRRRIHPAEESSAVAA